MKITTTAFFVLLFITSIFGGAFLDYFHVWTQGENVVLEWRTQEEKDVKNFVIERKNPQGSFVSISTIQPKGSYSTYNYTDEAAYKMNDLIFVYRLKIVDNNSSSPTYSNPATVSPNISDVRRTWGSIKAMFR